MSVELVLEILKWIAILPLLHLAISFLMYWFASCFTTIANANKVSDVLGWPVTKLIDLSRVSSIFYLVWVMSGFVICFVKQRKLE